MKQVVLVILATSLIAGCSADYSMESFERFRAMADRNDSQAIEELRIFAYYNPDHAEGQYLLGRLLVESNESTEREFLLAQHYLRRASELTNDPELYERAEQLILQAQLARGMSPGDPSSIIRLAEFAIENDRPARAGELYLDAALQYLYDGDQSEARRWARESVDAYVDHGTSGDTDDAVVTRYQETLHLIATVLTAEANYEEASNILAILEGMDIRHDNRDLPSIELIRSINRNMASVASTGVFSRIIGWWGSDEAEATDFESIFTDLYEADRTNVTLNSEVHAELSYQIWREFQEATDTSGSEELEIFIEERVNFYRRRVERNS